MIIDFQQARKRAEALAALNEGLETFEIEFTPRATLIERLRATHGDMTSDVIHIAVEESK